jgi:hypothetical protein
MDEPQRTTRIQDVGDVQDICSFDRVLMGELRQPCSLVEVAPLEDRDRACKRHGRFGETTRPA